MNTLMSVQSFSAALRCESCTSLRSQAVRSVIFGSSRWTTRSRGTAALQWQLQLGDRSIKTSLGWKTSSENLLDKNQWTGQFEWYLYLYNKSLFGTVWLVFIVEMTSLYGILLETNNVYLIEALAKSLSFPFRVPASLFIFYHCGILLTPTWSSTPWRDSFSALGIYTCVRTVDGRNPANQLVDR